MKPIRRTLYQSALYVAIPLIASLLIGYLAKCSLPDSSIHYFWRSFGVYDPFRQLFIKQRGLPNEKHESKFSSSTTKEKN